MLFPFILLFTNNSMPIKFLHRILHLDRPTPPLMPSLQASYFSNDEDIKESYGAKSQNSSLYSKNCVLDLWFNSYCAQIKSQCPHCLGTYFGNSSGIIKNSLTPK